MRNQKDKHEKSNSAMNNKKVTLQTSFTELLQFLRMPSSWCLSIIYFKRNKYNKIERTEKLEKMTYLQYLTT